MPQHPKLIERREKWLKDRMKEKKTWESQESKDEAYAEFYKSKQWKALKELKLYNDPDCEYHDFFFPQDKGIVIPAVEVDHEKNMTGNPELALTYDNLRSTCFKCHRKKTRLDYTTAMYKSVTGEKLVGIEKQNKLDNFDESINGEV
jgi:5-methylcytosine-specific restriction endonuclease McrA